MCGIAGFIDIHPNRSRAELERIGTAMSDRIAHRGPDDAAIWSDADAGACLAHRRLSIIDVSPAGRQPMVSASGRYVLAYNGEIYNHAELRWELEAAGFHCWRGHSDTEVLVEYIARHGLEQALRAASGMFALAVWDRRDRRLALARDRAGEKPLYYGIVGGAFVFASELKALTAHPEWVGELDRAVLPSYLRFGYVPAPHSIYRGVHKLEPGCLLSAAAAELGETQPSPFWEFPLPRAHGISPMEAVDKVDAGLRRAVRRQMEADVPLGCFLSGGIDSSCVTALAQAQSTRPVRSFSIGFDDPRMNEAPFAAAVAAHLGTDHTELYVDARQGQATAPELANIYDEPFADSSQIPTLLLSRLTRQHVTVALSGDGGDELFGGYDRYHLLGRAMPIFRLPASVRRAAAEAMTRSPVALLQAACERMAPSIGPLTPSRAERVAAFMRHPSGFEAYRDLMSQFADPGEVATYVAELPTRLDCRAYRNDIRGLLPWAAFVDAVSYLPDDILVKVDRASMAASLEVRVPMLDPEVIQLAAGLPWSLKRKGGVAKWPLRRVLARYVPPALFERPKQGFGVPLSAWLRGELRPWAESLLCDGVGLMPDLLDPVAVQRLWREHLSGERDQPSRIWTLLMLQQWAVNVDCKG